jgi:hypothetical protein
MDSDFCNNHSRQVGECPQEACRCGDCGHIRIGRGRDNRIPMQATAWQGRPPEPLARDESRLQSGRDQVVGHDRSDAAVRNCSVIQSRARSALNRRCRHLGAGRRGRASVYDEGHTTESRDVAARIRRGGATAGQCPGMCALMLRLTVDSDHSVVGSLSGCRCFNALQIRDQDRALHVLIQ